MSEDLGKVGLVLAIIASSIVYGIFVGRSQGARLRQLGDDLKVGRPRGFAIIAAALGLVVLFSIIQ